MLSPILGYVGTGEPSASATQYVYICGGTFNATQSGRLLDVPVDMTLSKLTFALQVAPGSGKSWTFTVMKNSNATSLSVTISDNATTGVDNTNSVSFTQGDTITLRSVPSGTPASPGVGSPWCITASASGQPIFGNANVGTTGAHFGHLIGQGFNSTESFASMVMPTDGTFSNLYARVSVAPGAGTSKITTLRDTGVDTALTVTISDANTTGSDLTHTGSLSVSDRVVMSMSVSGSPTSSLTRYSLLFTPSNSGESITGIGNVDAPSISATEYAELIGGGSSFDVPWDATESLRQSVISDSFTITALVARTNVAAGTGDSYILTLRKNANDTALQTTHANTTAIQTDTDSISLAQGDLLSFASAITGTPTTVRYNAGVLFTEPTAIQSITPSTIGSGNSLFAPTLIKGQVDANPSLLASGNQLYTPTLTAGSVSISPSNIVSGSVMYMPTLAGGQVTISPSFITSGSQLYAPTVSAGTATISPNTIASGSQLFSPNFTFGQVNISPGFISSNSEVYLITTDYVAPYRILRGARGVLLGPRSARSPRTRTRASRVTRQPRS